MKLHWFLILFFNCYLGNAQIELQYQLPNNEFESIDFSKLLIVPRVFIDSLILNSLQIPFLDDESEGRHSYGTLFTSYIILNDSLLESKIVRGLSPDLSSLLRTETDKIFNVYKSHLALDSLTKYRVFIGIRYTDNYKSDTIFLDTLKKVYTVARVQHPLKSLPISLNKGIVLDRNPKNLDDCLKQLDLLFDEETKVNMNEYTEEEFGSELHMWIGIKLRNYWNLWGGSELSEYFNELGIFHPDDMTGILFTSYHRYITGKPLLLEEQIEYYQEFWERKNIPEKD
jgi:hypothetical protein